MSDNKKDNGMTIDSEEFDAAVEEAKNSTGAYVHKFKTPFTHESKVYTELCLDLGGLRGKDFFAIERELNEVEKITVLVPTMNTTFILATAARAAGVSRKIFDEMPFYDVNAIRSKVRSFLLRSEF